MRFATKGNVMYREARGHQHRCQMTAVHRDMRPMAAGSQQYDDFPSVLSLFTNFKNPENCEFEKR